MKKILSLICAVLILTLPVCGQGEAAQHDFGSASGLYILGQAVSGGEFIEEMTGLIEISQLQG